jgi:hypothetical protein
MQLAKAPAGNPNPNKTLLFFAPRTRTDSAPGITKLEYLILNHHTRMLSK